MPAPGLLRTQSADLRNRPVRLAAANCVALVALAAMLPSAPALAQSSSASYQLPRQSIDGGNAQMASASYVVDGTIGQPDAAPAVTSAGYEVRGGFHRAAAALPDPVFANGFE